MCNIQGYHRPFLCAWIGLYVWEVRKFSTCGSPDLLQIFLGLLANVGRDSQNSSKHQKSVLA